MIYKPVEEESEMCPLCHTMGMPHHMRSTYKSKKPNRVPTFNHYLEFRHADKGSPKGYRRCYVGSVKDIPKSLYDILEKKDIDRASRYEKASYALSKEMREYLNKYSPNTSRKMEDVAEDVLSIMEKYGF